jgi:hypothetical protein
MNPNSLAFFSLESQFPTAAVAFELLFRLRLDGCASAMWTLHRTNLSHEIPHAFQSPFISQTIKQTSRIVPTIPYPNIRNLLTEGLPTHDSDGRGLSAVSCIGPNQAAEAGRLYIRSGRTDGAYHPDLRSQYRIPDAEEAPCS